MYCGSRRKSAVTGDVSTGAGSLPGVRGRLARRNDPADQLRATCVHCTHPVRVIGPADLWECASCALPWQRRREQYGDVRPAYGGR